MSRTYNQKALKERRQALRRDLTEPERQLWHRLRGKQLFGIKFRRQASIGPYIVDFYFPRHKLVIELDGESHYTTDAPQYDQRRTQFLELQDLRVIRFTNLEVMDNLDGVCQKIWQVIEGEGDTTPFLLR